MTPYIIVAITCTLLTYLGTHVRPKSISKYFFIATVFFTCFLASVRDSTIGTDVMLYGDRLFYQAYNDNLISFLSNNSQEPLFLILTYILSKISNRYVYYFVLQLLAFLPLYVTLLGRNFKKKAWIGVLLYYLWLYSYSLNLMRQTIAVSLLIFGTKYILHRKYINYFIIICLAMGFHITGIIGLVPLIMYKVLVYEPNSYLESQKHRYNQYTIKTNHSFFSFELLKRKYHIILNSLCILTTVGIVFWGSSIISVIHTLTGRFGYQVNHISGSFNFNARYFLVMMFLLFIIYIILKHQKTNKEPENQLYLMLLLSGIILFQLMGISFQMYRVSLYFTSYLIIFIPKTLSIQKGWKHHCSLIISIILLSYLLYQTVVLNTWNEIYPYSSEFLGI